MSLKNPILSASSKNIGKEGRLKKIKLLEDELSRLTILENPLEIQDICTSIIDLKKSIEEMPLRKS